MILPTASVLGKRPSVVSALPPVLKHTTSAYRRGFRRGVEAALNAVFEGLPLGQVLSWELDVLSWQSDPNDALPPEAHDSYSLGLEGA